MAATTCAQGEAKTTPGTAVYRRRQPERSAVYQVVQGHLETWLAGCQHADEEASPIAAHIEQDFRKYLECGILAETCWSQVALGRPLRPLGGSRSEGSRYGRGE
jgi:hypothetical protein